MHNNPPHIIRMCLERVHPLQGVIIEDSNLHVIGTGHDPVLPGNEFCTSDRQIAHLERLHELLVLMVPNVYVAAVEGAEHPRLGRMKIHTFDTI